MSGKCFQDEIGQEVNVTSLDNNMGHDRNETGPGTFHPVACPECGKDTLDLIDSGVSMRSPILGIASDGEVGCLYTELTGDYQLGIYCRHCGHGVCGGLSVTGEADDEIHSEWAKSPGEPRTVLPFICSKCGSRELRQVEVGITFSYAVVAVCEADVPGTAPLVALSHLRNTDGGGTYRYRCSQGHELAKDDGSPVETVDELVAWLKAQCAGDKD
jgi:hypothetical protein